MARPNYSDRDRERARAIYEERGPTVAAEALGCSKGTIGKWAKDGDWRTVRVERTHAATEAAAADRALKREELRNKLLDQAIEALTRMNAAHVEFVGKDGRREELEHPSAGGFKDYAVAARELVYTFRLEMGEATSREEQVRRDKVEAEADRLLAQLGNVNGNGSARTRA